MSSGGCWTWATLMVVLVIGGMTWIEYGLIEAIVTGLIALFVMGLFGGLSELDKNT